MINFHKLNDIIINNNTFLLTTHVNPDTDAIGSEIAFYQILNQLGKQCFIVNHNQTPYNLEFLDTTKKIEKFNPGNHVSLFTKVDVLVALDFNRSERLVSMQQAFDNSSQLKICIDHHQSPEDFVDHQFIDTEYSATGHILYDLIKETGIVSLNKNIAYPIYAAIMTDTGSFRFERTTSTIHRIAADLLDLGVDPGEVYNKIYDECKFSKIKLLGRTLDTFKLIADGRIGYMTINQKTFNELNALESDTDSFVNYTLSIENVVMGMLFIELKNEFKVSFRSKGNIQVNKFAEQFGGGGHSNAAGARFHNLSMTEKIPEILKESEKFLRNYLKE